MYSEQAPEKVTLVGQDGMLMVREMDSETAWIRSDTVREWEE